MKRMWSKNELRKIIQETYGIDINNLIDKDSHERFIEGDGTPLEQEGFTPTYCKWSLSGTHLMVVLAGSIADTTVIAGGVTLASFEIPNWIMAKIYPVQTKLIEYKDVKAVSSSFSSQTLQTYLNKETNTLNINATSALTLSADRGFRVAYDLLIDNE